VLKYETETRNDAHRRDMGHVGANNLISPATLIINLFMFMLGQVAGSSVSLTVCCDSRQLRQRHMNIWVLLGCPGSMSATTPSSHEPVKCKPEVSA